MGRVDDAPSSPCCRVTLLCVFHYFMRTRILLKCAAGLCALPVSRHARHSLLLMELQEQLLLLRAPAAAIKQRLLWQSTHAVCKIRILASHALQITTARTLKWEADIVNPCNSHTTFCHLISATTAAASTKLQQQPIPPLAQRRPVAADSAMPGISHSLT